VEVKVVYYNVLSPYIDGVIKYTEDILAVTDSMTLKDIFATSKQSCADVSKYYKVSENYYYNNNQLPYIKKIDGEIIWEPSYEDVKVIEFIYTHDINDNTIYADTGIPQAGGPDLKVFIDLWNEYYPIIDQISSLYGFYTGIVGIGLFIKSIFVNKKKKSPPPQGVFDLILSKNKWNHFELSVALEIDVEATKKLLQAFGYRWDNSKKLYIHQGDINEIIEKLSKVSFYEHE